MTKTITIWDTSVGTRNVGDEIINDAVRKELIDLYKKDYQFMTVPTHDIIGRYGRNILKESECSFVAGTNILTAKYHLLKNNQWNLRFRDLWSVRNVVLLGVGWNNYQAKTSWMNKLFYRTLFSKKVIHSVRDNYTKEKLESIGITNVVNTGCATLWRLTPEHCATIPTHKGKQVVTTITDYRKDKTADEAMLKELKKQYGKVSLWLQGSHDEEYFETFSDEAKADVIKIPGIMDVYNDLLEKNIDLDFVGTRLHAGIRAMQKGRRAVIIGVDNRSIEMKRDWDLPVLERENIAQLSEYINHDFETKINLDFDLIEKWKAQFKHE
ncbi:polysaccharide pyruvyl transferase family protein [Lactococcus sp.]|uniref:polysaccharide pyruvyl transferase family protein n=1 Tax=Lactococcus sp. TaxID=44273 RepID=UPI0035B0FF24